MIRDTTLARRLGETGHTYVKTHFGIDKMIAQFAELYEELARSKGIEAKSGT